MAKAAAERTVKQKALDVANTKYDAAVALNEKTPNAANKKAMEDADTTRKAANALVKRENFVRVAGSRVKKVGIAIRNLGNVNNLRTYTYTEADVAAAEKALTDKLKATIAAMRNGLNTSAAAPKEQEAPLFSE